MALTYNIPVSAVAVNICDGIFSPRYDIVWSIKYEVTDWTNESEYGICFFLRDGSIPLSAGEGGGAGIDLGYSGDMSPLNLETRAVGLKGGVLGVGLDTRGAFAAATTWPSGESRSGINNFKPNSITMRGGVEDNFDYLNVHLPITAFNMLSDGVKVLRARLGNFGRTMYIDYRQGEGDTDFINILTEDVNLNIGPDALLTPGVSFAKPLITSNNITIKIDTFHIEGKDTHPDISIEYPQSILTPLECDSFYTGEAIEDKPEIEFSIKPPVEDIIMCSDSRV